MTNKSRAEAIAVAKCVVDAGLPATLTVHIAKEFIAEVEANKWLTHGNTLAIEALKALESRLAQAIEALEKIEKAGGIGDSPEGDRCRVLAGYALEALEISVKAYELDDALSALEEMDKK